MIQFITPAILFGGAWALTPGPLLTLLITETLRGGTKSGALVALSPIVIDGPLIIAAIILAGAVSTSPLLLGILSLLGACTLVWLAYQILRGTPEQFQKTTPGASFWKAVAVDLLGPEPYIAWFSIATPIFARSTTNQSAIFAGTTIVTAMVIMLSLVFAIAKMRIQLLHYLRYIMPIISFGLCVFAGLLLRDGLHYLLS